MKKLLLLLMFATLSGNVLAGEPAKVAVVDMQKLLDSSTAASGIKGQAKKEREQYQASVAKEEGSLRKEEAKLAEQRTLLTQEAFNEKRRQFNEKVTKVQHDFQEKRTSQEAALKKSLDQVNQVIFEIIDALAQEEGFDIAIPTSQILYAAKKLDITDKVLERLNKKLPQLNNVKAEGERKSAKKPVKNKNADKN
jgi:hypothetical protein